MSDTIALNMTRIPGDAPEERQAIVASGLNRKFGSVQALRGLDLCVEYGSITGFVGNNGAGKTTTIHSLLGFILPHGGEIRVLGFDPQRRPLEIRGRVGFFPERDQPYDWMKVRILFDMGAAAYSTWDRSLEQRMCAQFDIDVRKRVKELSKGMVAKTKLIFALAHCPELLILDEPTSGLDPASRHELLRMIRELTAEQGVTTLFSSHNLEDVSDIASDLIIIHEGRVVLTDRMASIKNELRLIELRDYLEAPPSALREQLIKAVQQQGRSYWLVRNSGHPSVADFLSQNDSRIRLHRLTLSAVFLFLTRGWIELSASGEGSA